MPRLGLHALAPQDGSRRGPLMALARFLYILAWVMLLVRFLVLLAVVLLSLTVGLSSLRQAEIQLPCDLLVSSSFVGFMGSLALLWMGNRFRTVGGIPAMLGLTFLAVVTVILPEAIIWKGSESKQAEQKSTAKGAEPAQVPLEPWRCVPDDEHWYCFPTHVNALWFYVPTTMPGFLRRLPYGVIILWATAAALIFAWLATRRGRPDSDSVEKGVGGLLFISKMFWILISFIILIVVPLWELYNFWQLLVDASLPRRLYKPDDQWAKTLTQFYELVWLPFALAAVGLLSSRQLRAAAAPLLDFGLDVLNYFPPIRRADWKGGKRWSIDSWPWLRRILGGWQSPSVPSTFI
jgi:hypothetical protein